MILLRACSFASADFICAMAASCQVVWRCRVARVPAAPLQHPLCGRAAIDLVARSPLLQRTPLAQIVGRLCLDKVAHKSPRAVDVQDEVTRELCQVVHVRDGNHCVRGSGAISHEKRNPLSVTEPMDDRVITSEAEGEQRIVTVRQPDFEVSVPVGTQLAEADREATDVRTPLNR